MKCVTLHSSDVQFRSITLLTLSSCDPVRPSALKPAKVELCPHEHAPFPAPNLGSDGTTPGSSHMRNHAVSVPCLGF